MASPKRRQDLHRVKELLAGIGEGAVRVDENLMTVAVPVESRVTALVKVAQAIDAAGIELSDLGVQRPSLDDVFLAITGKAGGDGSATNGGQK